MDTSNSGGIIHCIKMSSKMFLVKPHWSLMINDHVKFSCIFFYRGTLQRDDLKKWHTYWGHWFRGLTDKALIETMRKYKCHHYCASFDREKKTLQNHIYVIQLLS